MSEISGSLLHLRRMAKRTRAVARETRDAAEASSLYLLAADLDAEAEARERAADLIDSETP